MNHRTAAVTLPAAASFQALTAAAFWPVWQLSALPFAEPVAPFCPPPAVSAWEPLAVAAFQGQLLAWQSSGLPSVWLTYQPPSGLAALPFDPSP